MKKIKELISNQNWDLKSTCLVLAIIFFLSLGLRITQPFLTDRITKDGVLYVHMAEDITKTNSNYQPFARNRRMPPLYIYMIAGASKYLNIHPETAGRLISILFGALLVIPVFFITKYLFDSRIAGFAAFLVGVNPYLIDISASIMRDSLFVTLLFSTLFFIIKSITCKNNKSYIYWGVSGIFLTLAIATRNEAIEIVGISFLFIFLCNTLKRSSFSFKLNIIKLFVGFIIMLTVSYLVSIPITNSLQTTSSTWTLVDQRIPGYFKAIMHISTKTALKKENTL